jgi:hypothetical protein
MKPEDRFSKSTQVSNFMKTHPVGAELLHMEGHMNRHDKTVTFRNFVNTPNNTYYTYISGVKISPYLLNQSNLIFTKASHLLV